MAKGKKKVQQAATEGGDEPVGSIFDHFAAMGRPLNGTPDSRQAQKPVTSEELLGKIAGLEEQNKELQAASRDRQYPMLIAGEQQQQHVDPSKLKVDLTGLPDQLEKPAEYNQQLQERVNAAIAAQVTTATRQVQAQFEQRSQADRLWQGFREAHPEWAKYEPLVESVATRVASDASARGVDLKKYMFQNPTLFYEDLANALTAGYGKLVTEGDEGEGEQEPETGDVQRTAGIDAGGAPGQGPKLQEQAKPKAGDMMTDLANVQRSMGLF